MPQVEIDEQVFKAAQRRAADVSYPTVDAYIADVVAHNLLEDSGDETPNLDHLFTPRVVADLERISAAARAGGKTYTPEEVREHLRRESDAWRESKAK